jgi:hypothetical protein
MDGFGDRSVINKLHKLGTHEWNLAIWLKLIKHIYDVSDIKEPLSCGWH